MGVDTSQKLEQLPMVVAAVKIERPRVLDNLRDKIRKRHPGIASRRRIKSSDLTNRELEWFVNQIDIPYTAIKITSTDLNYIKQRHSNEKAWKFRFLGGVYYQATEKIYDPSVQRVSVDRDYIKTTMQAIISTMASLFSEKEDISHIIVSTAESDEIKIADLVAGTARRGLIATEKFDRNLVRKIFSTRRPSQARMHPSRLNNRGE